MEFFDFSDKVTEKRLSRALKNLGRTQASSTQNTTTRLAYLEERLRVIEERLGITPPPPPADDPIIALEQGVEDEAESDEEIR